MNSTKWVAHNEITRKYEEIDPDEAELFPGKTILKKYWCASVERFVTIPGASLYIVTHDGSLALVSE